MKTHISLRQKSLTYSIQVLEAELTTCTTEAQRCCVQETLCARRAELASEEYNLHLDTQRPEYGCAHWRCLSSHTVPGDAT